MVHATAVSTDTVEFTAADWAPLVPVQVQVPPVPPEVPLVQLTLAPWTANDRGGLFGMSILDASGGATVTMGQFANKASSLAAILTPASTTPGELRSLRFADRYPLGTSPIVLEIDGKVLPIVQAPAYDVATHQLAWQQSPASGIASERSMAAGTIELIRGGVTALRWRVIAAPTPTAAPGPQSLRFPDLPGASPHEPMASEKPSYVEIQLSATADDGLQRAFEEHERALSTDTTFGVPGTTFITRSTASIRSSNPTP